MKKSKKTIALVLSLSLCSASLLLPAANTYAYSGDTIFKGYGRAISVYKPYTTATELAYTYQNTTGGKMYTASVSGTINLKKGSSGESVKALQRMLNASSLPYQLEVDGKFGTDTQKAVKAFQRTHGLDDDGICGPKTWKKLNAVL